MRRGRSVHLEPPEEHDAWRVEKGDGMRRRTHRREGMARANLKRFLLAILTSLGSISTPTILLGLNH